MSHIHVSNFKFRPPMPDAFKLVPDPTQCPKTSPGRKNTIGREDHMIWVTSGVPSSLILALSAESSNVACADAMTINRHSTCMLEADARVDGILNQKFKVYSTFSQTTSEVKMVQSLIAISEELKSSGLMVEAKPVDSSKPDPGVVLRSFLEGRDYEAILESGMSEKLTNTSPCTPGGVTRAPNWDAVKEDEHADADALGLLSWLASSQAADDLATDDELTNEALVSPLFPRSSLKEAIEAARLDLESASQQECQDILDSVEGVVLSEVEGGDNDGHAHGVSDKIIPQFDGSYDGSIEGEVCQHRNKKRTKKSKGKRSPWGPLPFSAKMEEDEHSESSDHQLIPPDVGVLKGEESSEAGEDKKLTSSTRDLMRRNRIFQPELVDHKSSKMTLVADMDETSAVRTGGDKSLFHDNDPAAADRNIHLGGMKFKRGHSASNKVAAAAARVDSVLSEFPTSELHLRQMRLAEKPPSREQVHTGLSDQMEINWNQSDDFFATSHPCDFRPFFDENIEDKEQGTAGDGEWCSGLDNACGVPTHFQNDGSVLYMLTYAYSPPSPDSVRRWLLEPAEEPRPHGGNDKQIPKLSEESFQTCDKSGEGDVEEYNYDDNSSPQHCIANYSKGNNALTSNGLAEPSILGKEREAAESWHDISQISGPERALKLTPLSQIGFRDPASCGRGQQLSIISLEVFAECRGNLRPDPRFDHVNIVCLVVEEDVTNSSATHVLMRSADDGPCKRNIDGIASCSTAIFSEEKHLLNHLVDMISLLDPDILVGWDVQLGSLGYLAERAAHLGIPLLKRISRVSAYELKPETEKSDDCPEASGGPVPKEIVDDDWGRAHASGVHVGGRIVLNLWRLMRGEIKLNMYSVEAVADELLRLKIPLIPHKTLNQWFSGGPGYGRHRCVEYVVQRTTVNLRIINQLDMINRTSELARVFGIDFFSVLSRGSQYRVESMLLRLAHTQNYLAISPGSQQVAMQPAMECLPLVMDPESKFFTDPVVVLDFQSLYPSMIIAYNICYSTCMGKVYPSKSSVLGVTTYSPDPVTVVDLKDQVFLTPNGVLYVKPKVRRGVLPRLLDEILSTRISVKQAMKKLTAQQVLHRIYNARQLALKLISNVTYGYTAAGFSGRMPCAEIADSIVQCGRRTLEKAISLVNGHPDWKARVVYGDTDSMFVLLRGRSVEEAFVIGKDIAAAVTSMNPEPVILKLEKVFLPCFLLTKKRYVGYSYESSGQQVPVFDAKGIETIRRDTCPAVSKILEHSITLMFQHQNICQVKSYLERQWTRILSGKVSLQDFIFAKEVRLGTYSTRASASLPPAAIVATKAMLLDPRAQPHYGERIPYVIIHGEPGARLVDMVIDPYDLLDVDSRYRLNDTYYIKKQINPALQRIFGLVGADVGRWFGEIRRPVLGKQISLPTNSANDDRRNPHKGGRIDTYYASKHCLLCGSSVLSIRKVDNICTSCSKNAPLVAMVLTQRASKLEQEMHHLAAVCRHCGGADWVTEAGVKCISLSCPVFYERRKLHKALTAASKPAASSGFYPPCLPELF